LGTRNTRDYKGISVEETVALLEATENGLSESEAKSRIEKFGYNEVVEEIHTMLTR